MGHSRGLLSPPLSRAQVVRPGWGCCQAPGAGRRGLGQLTTELTFHEFDQASQAECNRCRRHCRGCPAYMMHQVPASACMPPRLHHPTVLVACTAMHRWHLARGITAPHSHCVW